MVQFDLQIQTYVASHSEKPSVGDTTAIRSIPLKAGDFLFLLGANGTGKSSLMHRFYTANAARSRRITAHRQTWFESDEMTITAFDRRNTGAAMINWDSQPTSRWREEQAAKRPSIDIFDLMRAEGTVAHKIKDAAFAKDDVLISELTKTRPPIEQINDLFRLSNLPITLRTDDGEKITAIRDGIGPYSIAELSDGERSALLLAANILTAPDGCLFLIDEPERHLHRSIVTPLLRLLFEKRPDCVFVVSTHELGLPADFPDAQVALIRGCKFANNQPSGWQIDLLPSKSNVPDDLKADILGARQKLVFVEGTATSLDTPLYAILFPNVSVVAKDGCRDVEMAVKGLRGASDAHWIKAFGIIDNDRRIAADLAQLKTDGVFAIDAYSVESIYYHPQVQGFVAEVQAKTLGANAGDFLRKASEDALEALKPESARMSSRVVEKQVRNNILTQIPDHREILNGPSRTIVIDAAPLMMEEQRRFDEACSNGDLETLIFRYPVRETPALDRIAKAMKFVNRKDYEAAVRQMFLQNSAALSFSRTLFGTLYDELK